MTAAFTASGPPRRTSARNTATATPLERHVALGLADDHAQRRGHLRRGALVARLGDEARGEAHGSDAFSSCCFSVCRKMVRGAGISTPLEADERGPPYLVDVALGRADHEIRSARHAQPPQRLQLGAPHERPRLLLWRP